MLSPPSDKDKGLSRTRPPASAPGGRAASAPRWSRRRGGGMVQGSTVTRSKAAWLLMTEDLVDLTEVGDLLGASRHWASFVVRRPDFPAPVWVPCAGGVAPTWRRGSRSTVKCAGPADDR